MNRNKYSSFYSIFILLLSVFVQHTYGQLKLNQIFSDNMVLQRGKAIKIWGWSFSGDSIMVSFENQKKYTTADASGAWNLYLDPLKSNSQAQNLRVAGKKSSITLKNVLIGDVWLLGGQSNMEMDLDRLYNGDLEVASANFNHIRLMTIPKSTGVIPRQNFESINEYDDWLGRYDRKGEWFICNPETVKTFSGIGYIFGRRIHMATQVPIGLIDASLGGTTLEAWLSPDGLKNEPENSDLIAVWKKKADTYDPVTNLETKIANWEKRSKERALQGLAPLPKPLKADEDPALNRNYPGASFNGMINPISGLSLKGIVFHQGYNNALSNDARPKLYAKNMIGLVRSWRNTFQDSDLPFGIIELSAGGTPQTLENIEVQMTDAAPFIREAQFNAYKQLEHVGFACAYDNQENWYHPRKKIEPTERMARWALDRYYSIPLGWKPTEVVRKERKSDSMVLVFSGELKTTDDRPFEGFTIAGKDGHFFPATADYFKVEKDQNGQDILNKKILFIHSKYVSDPVEVRYAWARNPLGNVVSAAIRERVIPLPSFRTDTWDYPEAPCQEAELELYRKKFTEYKNKATLQNAKRKQLEK